MSKAEHRKGGVSRPQGAVFLFDFSDGRPVNVLQLPAIHENCGIVLTYQGQMYSRYIDDIGDFP